MKRKISVIGAGNVGASLALYLAEANLADIVLVDIVAGIPQGKALDLSQASPLRGYNSRITGTNDYREISESDMVIITAGLPRKPGMSREDLLSANADIVGKVATEIKAKAPGAFVLVVSNPLDIMTYHAFKKTGFPASRVFGQAGVLDAVRFRTFVALELGVAFTDTQAMVLGGHGDTMVPLPRYSTVSGIPITELIPQDRIEAICERTRNGGAEIVTLLKTGSAFYAPAAATAEMAKAVFSDEKKLLPASAYLEGPYGLSDLYIGVPVILGAGGVEKVVELNLEKEEKEALAQSAAAYKEMLKFLGY